MYLSILYLPGEMGDAKAWTGSMSCLVLAFAAAQNNKARHRLCSGPPADAARFLCASEQRLTAWSSWAFGYFPCLYMRVHVAAAAKISRV